jgi:hypothetical protein
MPNGDKPFLFVLYAEGVLSYKTPPPNSIENLILQNAVLSTFNWTPHKFCPDSIVNRFSTVKITHPPDVEYTARVHRRDS